MTGLNHIYRLVWSTRLGSWVAASELCRGRGKTATGRIRLRRALLALGLIAPPVLAAPPAPTQLPTGGSVAVGAASLSQSGARLDINQSSQRAVINWNTFNVGAQAQVNFNQPGSSAVTLNRVADTQASQIAGKITANGQVFLVNPNGVYFSKGSSVDVGGLVATTHAISDADFMAGRNTFSRNGATGSVVNEGTLTAAAGGYIALLAPEVRNQGVIVAQMGTVALASGETISLRFDQNNTLAGLAVTPSQIQALVDNQLAVQAPGGLIILSAQAADRLLGGVVKNSGSLEASGLTGNGGRILLSASDQIAHTGSIAADAAPNSAGSGGTVSLIADLSNPDSITHVNGSISARGGALGGDGGFIETSGSHIDIAGARVDAAAPKGKAGLWLLDPTDLNIDSTYLGGTVFDSTALNSPTGWTGSVPILSRQCGGVGDAGCSSTDWAKPYIGAGSVVFSLVTDYVAQTYFLPSSATKVSFSATVPAMSNGFANVGNVQLVFLNALGAQVGVTQTSASITQNAGSQSVSGLSNVTVPAGTTQVQVIFNQTTSANGWAGDYGIAFNTASLIVPGGGLVVALNGGTTVSATASNNLYVNAPIVTTGAGAGGLTLIAGRGISINQNITLTGAGAALSLQAGTDISVAAPVATNGPVSMAAGGNLAIVPGGSVGTTWAGSNALVLAAGAGFLNMAGASAVSATGAGANWLIYSASPAGNNFGGLASGNAALWNQAYTGTNPVVGGNRYLFSYQPIVAFAAVDQTKVYGTAVDFSSPVAGIHYVMAPDPLTNAAAFGSVFTQDVISGAPALSSAGAAAGAGVARGVPYLIDMTAGSLVLPAGYAPLAPPLFVPGYLTVTPAPLTLSTTPVSKPYDGTTMAAGSAIVTGGRLYGSDSIGGGQFAFTDPSPGNGKTVKVLGVTLQDGSGGGNYAVTYVDNTSSTILPATVPPVVLAPIPVTNPTPTASPLDAGLPLAATVPQTTVAGTGSTDPATGSGTPASTSTATASAAPAGTATSAPASDQPATATPPAPRPVTATSSAPARPVVARTQAAARTAGTTARSSSPAARATVKAGASAKVAVRPVVPGARPPGGMPPPSTAAGLARAGRTLPALCEALPCEAGSSPSPHAAGAAGNNIAQTVPGDAMAESFHESAWIDNAGIANVGKARATRQYSEQLESVNLMGMFTLFILP